MTKKNSYETNIKKLAKVLAYALGQRPDQFGLIPDMEGFIKIKDFLKGINEEEGWKHIRRKNLDEILAGLKDPPMEIIDNRIRAKCLDNLPVQKKIETPPKLLFTCIRRKAYTFVLDKGISPSNHFRVILSSDKDMAERIGKRTDPKPIILTINVQKNIDQGIEFFQVGETLYEADYIPPDGFTAPRLPKEKPKPARKKITKPEKPKKSDNFLNDLNKFEEKKSDDKKNKKDKISRKKAIQKARKNKQKMFHEHDPG